jgi:hypothetical protein
MGCNRHPLITKGNTTSNMNSASGRRRALAGREPSSRWASLKDSSAERPTIWHAVFHLPSELTFTACQSRLAYLNGERRRQIETPASMTTWGMRMLSTTNHCQLIRRVDLCSPRCCRN